MNFNNLTLDFEGANLIENNERIDEIGNRIIRQKLDNGFVWIRTETPNGIKRMDFSHELVKTNQGTYKVNIKQIKKDFLDYYED